MGKTVEYFYRTHTPYLYIYDPAPPGSPPPPPPKGGIRHTYAAMYRYNYMFVLIYVCMPVCLSVRLLVCKYVRVPARSTCHCFCVCTQRYYMYTYCSRPPPVGGLGGSYHLQPCIVCWYVSIYVSKQSRHVIVFVSAHKDTTCTHNVPAPPLWVGWGGLTICSHVLSVGM